MTPIKKLETDWYRHPLGPGYKIGWYSQHSNRIDDCRLTRAASNMLEEEYGGVLRRIERKEDMETFSEYMEDYYHNSGHNAISMNCSEDSDYGPMAYSTVSARDPIFWMWHKHLDSIFQQYKDTTQRR